MKKLKEQLIVVNADDFGLAEEINEAILTSLKQGWISTTTLMTNMAGFDHAIESIYENRISNRIGIHLNLTEGKPLTDSLQKFPEFVNKQGNLFKSRKTNILSTEIKEGVFKELQAQIDRFKATGYIPTHLDTHHHMHHYWDIGKIVIWLAKRNKIPAIRLRFNWGSISLQRKLFSKIYNHRLGKFNLAMTKIFCEIKDVNSDLMKKKCPMEIMVHPYPNQDSDIRNYKNGENLSTLIKKKLQDKTFTTYDFITKKYENL